MPRVTPKRQNTTKWFNNQLPDSDSDADLSDVPDFEDHRPPGEPESENSFFEDEDEDVDVDGDQGDQVQPTSPSAQGGNDPPQS